MSLKRVGLETLNALPFVLWCAGTLGFYFISSSASNKDLIIREPGSSLISKAFFEVVTGPCLFWGFVALLVMGTTLQLKKFRQVRYRLLVSATGFFVCFVSTAGWMVYSYSR